MDFAFTPDEEAFREEVGRVLGEELPRKWGNHLGGEFADRPWGDPEYTNEAPKTRERLKTLVRKRGWRPLAWPKAYGGYEAPIWQQVVFKEETVGREAPTGGGLGELFIGPAIMAYGTEDQKKQHLPPIAEGSDHWCQLYSEPDAGSDLASLKTRAVESGDGFVVNGNKIWTSDAPGAKWGFLFARTDNDLPRHRGISCFLIDMTTPGISVRPIPNMIRQYDMSEVFFEDVHIPRSALLGELNGGWRIMMSGVGFERGGTLDFARSERILNELVGYCKRTGEGEGGSGGRLFDDPVVMAKLARLRTKVEATRLVNYKTMSVWASGQLPDWEASFGKIFMDTLYQEVVKAALDIIGPSARVQYPDPIAPVDGVFEYHMRPVLHQTISPGTLQIQKNIVATRGLGLPRA